MALTDQQLLAIRARLQADGHYPPSLLQIKRVLAAAEWLGYIMETP